MNSLRTKWSVFRAPTVIAVACIYLCGSCSVQETKYCPDFEMITPVFEIDTKLIDTDSAIFFSGNASSYYSLYRYSNDSLIRLSEDSANVLHPFLFRNTLVGLTDSLGNEKFQPTSIALKMILKGEPIKDVFSFDNGNILVALKHDNELCLIASDNSIETIARVSGQINDVVYYEAGHTIIVSFDDTLMGIDIRTLVKTLYTAQVPGLKLNLSIHSNKLLFCSNYESEFYRIYQININHPDSSPELVLASTGDLRLPEYSHGKLFFIETLRNEYLLKSKDTTSERITEITTQGVVYDYVPRQNGDIAIVYSDLETPKCLRIYSPKNNTTTQITGSNYNTGLSATFVGPTERSAAYVLTLPANRPVHGLILYLHPGLHSDFSPRWDMLLMNLCTNGFIVVAPNYPMSAGFGKTFHDQQLTDAVDDLKKWTVYLRDQYKIPLHCLSSSSGNIIMENLIASEGDKITSSASLFGVPSNLGAGDIPKSILHILGGNDPFIPAEARKSQLTSQFSFKSALIIEFPDEGHWFRNSKNQLKAAREIYCYFKNNN
ncbi:MAG: hypothetical protein ABIS36_06540 [Chryseolinea sp.]